MPAEYIWAFFKLHVLIHVFSKKNVFVIIENLYTGSHFQMPTKIVYKEKKLVFGVWIVQFIVFVEASNTRPNEQ